MSFEASGGLVNSSLVMQDRETDTYWAIMEGKAVAGELEGTELVELPVGEKIQWRHWKGKHPDTLVLSVNGREDAPDAYAGYYREASGFRGQRAEDDRLPTKEPIFAFDHDGAAYASPQSALETGAVYTLEDGSSVLLYRRKGSSLFQSTRAYVSKEGFERRGDRWVDKASGAVLDPTTGTFEGGSVEPLPGFDTFWYTWSLNNPDTRLLR